MAVWAMVEDSDWLGKLHGDLCALIAPVFAQARSRFAAFAYVAALLAVTGDRKSCWQLGEQAGHATPRRMQALLAEYRWDWRVVAERLQCFILAHLADPEAILVQHPPAGPSATPGASGDDATRHAPDGITTRHNSRQRHHETHTIKPGRSQTRTVVPGRAAAICPRAPRPARRHRRDRADLPLRRRTAQSPPDVHRAHRRPARTLRDLRPGQAGTTELGHTPKRAQEPPLTSKNV